MSKGKNQPKVKNQHYVPQTYLKNFAYENTKVFVFDKVEQRVFASSIKNVASETYFNDFPADQTPEDVDPQIVEKAFAVLEGKYQQDFNELILSAHTNRRMDLQKRGRWSLFLAFQILRTRGFRDTYIAASKEILAKLLADAWQAEYPDEPLSEFEVTLKKEYEPVQHARFMFHPNTFLDLSLGFKQYIWIMGLNPTDTLLYTSDTPVVKRPHAPADENVSNSGWLSPGIEIAFPLTPHHLLILLEPTFFKKLTHLDGSVIDLSPESVEHYNILQVGESYRRIFSQSNNFTLKKLCEQYPELGSA